MKLKLPLLLVLVYAPVLWPQRAYKALAHTGCDTWQDTEMDPRVRITAQWTKSIGASGDPGRGVIAWIEEQPLFADFVDQQLSFINSAVWLATDSVEGTDGLYWIELGRTYDWDDVNGAYTHHDHFYWGRSAKEGSSPFFRMWYISYPLPKSNGTMYRYKIQWNPNADADGGYDIGLRIEGDSTNYHVNTAHINRPNAYRVYLGLESKYCDGNDGDSYYNYVAPIYTNSWWWTDDENQLHQIVNPSIPSNLNEPPAHIGLYPSGDSACYHMNRTTWC